MTYCGPPPLPETIWGRWNFDPVLLLAMALACLAFALLRQGATNPQRVTFAAAMLALVVAFVSPLCALTVALFSARVVHHVLLVATAAPLLALALPLRLGRLMAPLLALHTLTFWLWHAPDFYAAALDSLAVYWLMQISLLGTAVLLWSSIFSASRGRAIACLLGTIVQMGMLGALLVFASEPLYPHHFASTIAFGLDPKSDQQLAGLIMWVPASLPYIGVALFQLARWLDAPRAHQS
jgi:putative membrane protein